MGIHYDSSMKRRVVDLLPIQLELYNSKKTVAGIYSGRGVGKTYILSWIVSLSLLNGEKSIAFSQDYRSLTVNLFEEIQARLREVGVKYLYNKQMTSITVPSTKGRVFGYSYERIDSCRSNTNISLLACDEIALAPPELFSVAIPCLRGEGIIPRIRFCSTPRAGTYWNTEVQNHLKAGDWDIFSAPMESNTYLSKESIEASYSSITDQSLKDQELRGIILDLEPENSILSWSDFQDYPSSTSSRDVYCGIDFARFGVDSTVLCVRDEARVIEFLQLHHADTATIVSAYNSLVSKYGQFTATCLDATGGWHIGFYDALKDTASLTAVNFSGKGDQFTKNTRTLLYQRLSEAVRLGFYIPQREVREELINTTWSVTESGHRQLTPKSVIKMRLGHSPDQADSLALTFYPEGRRSQSVSPERIEALSSILFR